MSNQNYSAFSERTQNKNVSKPYVYRKGEMGAEHGPTAKDTPHKWPKAGGPRSPSMNTAGFPVIKFRVVSDGVEDGGQGGSDHFTK